MSFIQLCTGSAAQNYYAVFYDHEHGWIWDNAHSWWCNTSVSSGAGHGAIDYGVNWDDVAVLFTEDEGSGGDSTGHYQLLVPSALESRIEAVDVVVRRRVGVSPSCTDEVIGQGTHIAITHSSYLVTKSN